ncbi:hypothetical protein Tsubulata_038396 [Turnera subulata]|uniref:Pentatricopeptide repeat-containing protein n=1 Tax=Turnera subulata TaxID=218843 RepID=A0A9Q0J6Q9_9ROSI|nr:hypothetical protein Tsubulata_038396 [Turnera subulata]
MAALRELLTRRPVAARIHLAVPARAGHPEQQVGPLPGQHRRDTMPLNKYFSSRAPSTANLQQVYEIAKVRWLSSIGVARIQSMNSSYGTMVEAQMTKRGSTNAQPLPLMEGQSDDRTRSKNSEENDGVARRHRIGDNVSRKDKVGFLLSTLADTKDSKEAVYGVLDAWVAWEQTFPIVSIKRALVALEKEQQWHRVVQVIKWMLSKGQGATMGTYGQLIRALEMDHRAEEAHSIWQKKIGRDLHSVPWQLCRQMISIYYRNNMLENLVKVCFLSQFICSVRIGYDVILLIIFTAQVSSPNWHTIYDVVKIAFTLFLTLEERL